MFFFASSARLVDSYRSMPNCITTTRSFWKYDADTRYKSMWAIPRINADAQNFKVEGNANVNANANPLCDIEDI